MAKRMGVQQILVWIMLGLLIAGLAGFGITSFGAGTQVIAAVGAQKITAEDYARALQAEQARLQRQTGQGITLEQLMLFGFDQIVLERLITQAAFDEAARNLDVSVGDERLAREIRQDPNFQGIGGFDREGYAFALRQAGFTERAYEDQVRREIVRGLLQGAILGGIETDSTAIDTLLAWQFETRDVQFALLGSDVLPSLPEPPTQEQLDLFYTEMREMFMVPEGRDLTVAWISPDSLMEEIFVAEDDLRALYEDRRDEFSQPARVWAELLGFADLEAAQAARAEIDTGGNSFDALVRARGLTLEDVDQGELSAADVPAHIAEALFALEQPGLVGPLDTPIGPAIYRVTAILDPTEVAFEDVAADLRAEYADDQARRRIVAATPEIDDLLAAGATLEEIAQDTDLILENFVFRDGQTSTAIGNYSAFRGAALAAEIGDFPELFELSDGGIFMVRLNDIVPPTLPPLAEVENVVTNAWLDQETERTLTAYAAEVAKRLQDGLTWQDLFLEPERVERLLRDGFIAGVPRSAITEIFQNAPGTVLSGIGPEGEAYVLALEGVSPADLEAADLAAQRAGLQAQWRQSLAQDLYEAFGAALQNDIGLSLNQTTLSSVRTSLLQGGG